MNIEEARDYCLSKPHVTEDMPFGDDYVVFRIGGKIFAGLPLFQPNIFVLKCDPSLFDEMTDRYTAIQQAWHWHKRHWMQIDLNDSEMTKGLIMDLTDKAYARVYNKLTKAVKASLEH
ncbi:MAG: MmcQ/YjbR family DNA-binding protein [Marinilabiliaceae bacterium]|nr:MmcQ/YjbR family DNA-binding protein [Marinilabiliaceae bacterium]